MAIAPTKGNLMAVRRSLALAQVGYQLMDRKRNILIREIMTMMETAKSLQDNIDITFREAYAALQRANISLGIGNCEQIAKAIPEDKTVDIRFRAVMGVELPVVEISAEQPAIHYGLSETESVLDEVYFKFLSVKKLVLELAEVENSIYRLAMAIKKAQKRANALKNIVIPNFTESIEFITAALEEKDREEFVRLKVIKRMF